MCRINIQRIAPPSTISSEIIDVSIGQKRQHEEEPQEGEQSEGGQDRRRVGKWTPEEEAYADALIEKFEAGTLMDCPAGKTLRAYLSQKLNCIPMRVSKKYAGQCIGKQTYVQLSDYESPEEAERIVRLAEACWASIESRMINRRKRNRSVGPSSSSFSRIKPKDLPHSSDFCGNSGFVPASAPADDEVLTWEDVLLQTSFDDLLFIDDELFAMDSDVPPALLSDAALLL